ncbi:LZIC family protein [Cooperia oncophora]
MADAVLVGNLQNQLDRLMNQLSDLEEERPNMDAKEYEELKSETMEQLQDLSRTLEKMTGGTITVIDNLTATRMAVRAAISQAFRTPEIVALFARKQPAALRQKLIVMDNELRMEKITEKEYHARKLEILTALVNLKEELSDDEKAFLKQKQSGEPPRFNLEATSGNTVCKNDLE